MVASRRCRWLVLGGALALLIIVAAGPRWAHRSGLAGPPKRAGSPARISSAPARAQLSRSARSRPDGPLGEGSPVVAAGHGASTRQRRVVRRFLAAFLSYERGVESRSVRSALAGTASRPLAAELLGRSVRVPVSARPPGRAAIRGIVLYGPVAESLKAVVTLERDGHTGSLELALVRRHGRWRVARIG